MMFLEHLKIGDTLNEHSINATGSMFVHNWWRTLPERSLLAVMILRISVYAVHMYISVIH